MQGREPGNLLFASWPPPAPAGPALPALPCFTRPRPWPLRALVLQMLGQPGLQPKKKGGAGGQKGVDQKRSFARPFVVIVGVEYPTCGQRLDRTATMLPGLDLMMVALLIWVF